MQITDIEHIKQQMVVVADAASFPRNAFACAKKMAMYFDKEVSFLIFRGKKETADIKTLQATWNEWVEREKTEEFSALRAWVMDEDDMQLKDITERTEAVMVFFETHGNGRYRKPMSVLKICRELRIPYVMMKHSDNEQYAFDNILVPVTFLVEDKEKGPYSANMGRFAKSAITLMPAKDYGTKAAKNTESIRALYDKFNLPYDYREAKKDSFDVEKEAVEVANKEGYDLVIISASREYGLDDIIFGPKEYHAYNRTKQVPVMLINPRADLYVLCW